MSKERNPANQVDGSLSSDLATTTATDVIVAQGSGVRTYLQGVTVTNSHATQATIVQILCNSVVRYRQNAAAVNGGFVVNFGELGLRGVANTSWQVKCETAGATVQCSMNGYKSKEPS